MHRVKRKAQNGRHICDPASDGGLVSRLHRELLKLNSRK